MSQSIGSLLVYIESYPNYRIYGDVCYFSSENSISIFPIIIYSDLPISTIIITDNLNLNNSDTLHPAKSHRTINLMGHKIDGIGNNGFQIDDNSSYFIYQNGTLEAHSENQTKSVFSTNNDATLSLINCTVNGTVNNNSAHITATDCTIDKLINIGNTVVRDCRIGAFEHITVNTAPSPENIKASYSEFSGNVTVESFNIVNGGENCPIERTSYTVLCKEGIYNFNPFDVMVNQNNSDIELTVNQTSGTYTVTKDGATVTYQVTPNSTAAPTSWTVTVQTN